jgi:hypothetical protein
MFLWYMLLSRLARNDERLPNGLPLLRARAAFGSLASKGHCANYLECASSSYSMLRMSRSYDKIFL